MNYGKSRGMTVLAKTTTLDPIQVWQAEQLARQKWGPNALEPHFAALMESPPPAAALSRKYYLLAAAPQQEAKVGKALKDAGFDFYLPKEPKSVRVGHVKRRMVMKPMLPGYVFPIFDEHRDRWQIITRPDDKGRGGIAGVLRLFLWGDRPAEVGDEALQRMRDRELEEQMRGNIKKTASPYVAMPGHFVQIDDGGPWHGFIGEVVDLMARASRLLVELNVLGRKNPHRCVGASGDRDIACQGLPNRWQWNLRRPASAALPEGAAPV